MNGGDNIETQVDHDRYRFGFHLGFGFIARIY